MIAFKDFIEDYNTASMPHEKYYNYEAWEMNEYRKAQMDKMNKTGTVSVVLHCVLFVVLYCVLFCCVVCWFELN
jgi:hypothetical protein